MLNRPFLGPHRTKPTANSGKPTRPASSADQAVERRYRSLAFGYCRTAALRIITLVDYFIHSPCFTTAYDIFSACTILLLSPQDPEAMKAVRTGLGYLDRLERSHYWVEAADDARKRIWALAKRWNVRPLLDDLECAESTVSSASASEPSPSANIGAAAWDGLPPLDWNTLGVPDARFPVPDIGNDTFAGPDAALFATFPSIELGAMYGDLSSQMDLTPENDSWWFMGSQPLM
jgi:hypothetical protein